MKESFILMSTPMIHAMEREVDPKSETRRVVSRQPIPNHRGQYKLAQTTDDEGIESYWYIEPFWHARCPYGKPGDILLIKEAAWMWCERQPNGVTPTGRPKWHYVPMREAPVFYAAHHPRRPEIRITSPDTGNEWGWRFKVGRFLPRWAIRIKRVVTGIRVERLQDISEEDAKAEGVQATFDRLRPDDAPVALSYKAAYRDLWDSINGAGSWDLNPFVWVIEFGRIEP